MEIVYFPVLMSLDGPVVIFGGGDVGTRKANVLRNFGCQVVVVDKRQMKSIKGVKMINKLIDENNFSSLIPKKTSLVICALNNGQLNVRIANYCKERSIPVNVATDGAKGTVLFPAILKKDHDLVATSSLGSCPLCAYALKKYISRGLPNLFKFSNVIHHLKEQGLIDHDKINLLLDDEGFISLVNGGELSEILSYVEEKHGHC